LLLFVPLMDFWVVKNKSEVASDEAN